MKHSGLSRAIVAIAMMLIGWLPSLAHDFEVDGIFYDKLNSSEVAVTYKGYFYDSYSNEYIGDVVIPSSVNYNGVTYSVTSIGGSAFNSCTSLTSIQIPNSVTSIGEGAFYCCSMTSIEIGNSVTSIGYEAFAYCDDLTSIEIPNSVTSIGGGAFCYCTSLTSIVVDSGNTKYDSRNGCNAIIETTSNTLIAGCQNTIIPNSVTSIGDGAFGGCSDLTSIEIPNSVTSIGDSTFWECSSLTSVVIPNSVTSILSSAFYGCTSLTSIVIPNSVTSIGFSAFSGCSSLTSVVIPNSVTSIGFNAFAWCSSLTSIEIPNSVTSIGDWAFGECTSLTSIEIPNSVTSIGYAAFDRCVNLTSIVVDSGNTKYDSRNGCNAIIETASNTLIAGCQNTIIPNSVTSIGEKAFFGRSRLTSIEIPNSVTSIGWCAFLDCESLTKVTCLATNPPTIKSDAFNSYSADLYVPAGCKEAYEAAEYWNNFTNIIELEPELEEGATFEYEGLTYKIIVKGEELAVIASENGRYSGDIVIPSSVDYNGITYSVTSIGNGAFSDCSEITNVKIPQSVTSIGNSAFWGCTGLTTMIVPHFVLSIGDNAFAYCNGLTKVSIGFRVKSIGAHIFQNCPNLNSVYWLATECEDFTQSYLAPFDDSVTYFYFGDTVEHIPAFLCNGLSNLTSIEIPYSVTSIEDFAFMHCDSLTKITCLATTPPVIGSNTFTYYNADLYVPAGCKEAYEAAEYWNNFTNIIEIEESNVNLFINDFAINAGETKELAINLTNEIAFTGFQADLYLPDGLEIEQEEGDYIFELTDRKGSDHVITSGKQANGAIRILCFSIKLNEFSGSEGAVVKFRVTAANDFVGNYEINIKDIIFAQTDESEYQLPATTTKVEARMLAKSITLDRTEVSLKATQTTTLLATILPDNTSIKTVVWTSSDEDVAVVDENGVVTAIAIGEATITATTTDGTNLSASCKVTVVPTLGDANNDAVINVTDIMVVASYILGNTPEGFVFEAADVTKDGKINIIDIVAIANIILSSETPDETQLAARVARQTALGSRLFIDDTSIQEGETMQLAVNLTNDIAFSGFQADVKLPEGLELCQEDGEYMISLSDRKGSDHVLTSAMLSDGTIRILSYSMNLNDFAGADGALVYLTVKATQHFVGDYEISIDNITFTQADLTEYSLEPTVCRIAGTVGIEGIEAEQEAEYFNLQGLPVANPEKGGLYIIKRGNKVSKSIIK